MEVVAESLRRSAANVEVPSSNPGAAALGFFGVRYTSTGSPSLEWVLVGNYWLGRLMEPHGVNWKHADLPIRDLGFESRVRRTLSGQLSPNSTCPSSPSCK